MFASCRFVALIAGLAAAGFAQDSPSSDPAAAFFAAAPIVQVQILLTADAREHLRREPRRYVAGDLYLDGVGFARVGLKLKGAAGSFRDIDDRPGFTVHLGKFGKDERFQGLRRFHLNNGAQDDSRLCEWIGYEMFTAAGLPAPRVRLGTTDLGLYVFREAFDDAFLERIWGHTRGQLWDGGFCQDVDGELELDAGDGSKDRSALRALASLARGIDTQRATKLAAAIDIEHFIDFAALEAMLGHWDGYCGNANNYRLWLPTRGKAVFLPHGMDQLLQDAEASVLDHPSALVASAVMQQPAFRKRYRERLHALLPLFAPAQLEPRLTALATRLAAELRRTDPEAADAYAAAVRDLQERFAARAAQLGEQVNAPEPKPVPVPIGSPFALKKWQPGAETDGIELQPQRVQGVATLHARIAGRADEPRLGAFRTHVLLGPGRYELRGSVRCVDVAPPPADAEGRAIGGVHLRADGAESDRISGTSGWRSVVCAFDISDFQRSVELSCELHGKAGEVWFRLDSLQLVRTAR
jgi:spore coat protein H